MNHRPTVICEETYAAEFYFNFKTSIFGQVVPFPTSNSRSRPHLYFIATPLPPYGRVDPKVEKFTGKGDIGPASDHDESHTCLRSFFQLYIPKPIFSSSYAIFKGMHIPNSRSLINFKLVGVLHMQGTMYLNRFAKS